MIVVIAGMYRSGSTFSFNVVRESLIPLGRVECEATNSIPALRPGNGVLHLILKSHAPDEPCTELIQRGQVRCVCTYRRPEDAIASWIHAFGSNLGEAIEMMHGWLAWHKNVAEYVLNIRYEEVDQHPLRTIILVQRWLLGHVSVRDALRLRWKYDKRRLKAAYDRLVPGPGVRDIGFSYFDRTTFFHRRHLASVGGRRTGNRLATDDVLRIRRALSEYLDASGDYRLPRKAS